MMANRRPRIAMVTGANRGLGTAFVRGLFARGAQTVYACARDVASLRALESEFGAALRPLPLDLRDGLSVDRAAAAAEEVDTFVSNAGISWTGGFLDQTEEAMREIFDVNLWGPLRLTRALLPGLAEREGAILFVLSMASLLAARPGETYCASKSAALVMAQGIRGDVADLGVGVTISFPGFMDTDLASGYDIPKAPPALVAERSLEHLFHGQPLCYPDLFSRMTRDAMDTDIGEILAYPPAVFDRLVAEFRAHPDAGT